MYRPLRRELIRFAACAIVALVASPARAGEDHEHENARRAVERGEALPLADILRLVGGELGGEITRVSFEREHGRWVYEFKVVEPGGRLVEVYVDAASGRVLEREAD
ncbi:MAG TPA: PepSY domain-containing protein [Rhodospirillales bacterium]|nr:PepSY domain-containing protein [Rhodospirillales bacterium]